MQVSVPPGWQRGPTITFVSKQLMQPGPPGVCTWYDPGTHVSEGAMHSAAMQRRRRGGGALGAEEDEQQQQQRQRQRQQHLLEQVQPGG